MSLLRCPSCGFVGVEFSHDERLSAIGVCVCQECGTAGLSDDFESVDDFADTEIDGEGLHQGEHENNDGIGFF